LGKSSAPAAPNYAPIAASDEFGAQLQYNLGQQQLQFGMDQFNEIAPYEASFLSQESNASAAQAQQASAEQQYYNQTYQPIQTALATEANNYNTPGNANRMAGMAMADVSNTFNANKAATLGNLESYGIDPSQTRYQALDLGANISQAAATAAAGTQSYLNTQNTGMGLQQNAVNTGMGYAGQIASNYGGAATSGSAGIGAFNQTTNTAVNSMGTPSSYFSGATNANNGAASALNMGYNNALSGSQFEAQQSQSLSSGIGSLAGAGLMAAAMFA
jgi:hypothetical protein